MTVTLAVSYTSGNIDLLAGSDRLILGNFANTVTITNIETFVGGTTSDTVTLASSYTSDRIDLGLHRRRRQDRHPRLLLLRRHHRCPSGIDLRGQHDD